MPHSINQNIDTILSEIGQVLRSSDYSNIEVVLEEINNTRNIVCVGAGRVGLATDAFAKRLMHLGFQSHAYSDVTLPKLETGDLMIVASGSGNTESIVSLSKIAKRQGLRLVLISSNSNSLLTKIADVCFILNCPNKETNDSGINSIQPMTTLFEQSLSLFFDAVVLTLISHLKVTEKDMLSRHNAIE